MAGWYELSKSSNGQFRFVLKAANAETILTSELYTTRGATEAGIAQCRQTAHMMNEGNLVDMRPRYLYHLPISSGTWDIT